MFVIVVQGFDVKDSRSNTGRSAMVGSSLPFKHVSFQ
jgi:hypothetical protein